MFEEVISIPRPSTGKSMAKTKKERMIRLEELVSNSDVIANRADKSKSESLSSANESYDVDESSYASSCSSEGVPDCLPNEEGLDNTFIKTDNDSFEIPESFIPTALDENFVHGNHVCVVCDEYPIIGYRVHTSEFKAGQGCCFSCFEELYKSGDKRKRKRWLASVEPQQLESDVAEQHNYRRKLAASAAGIIPTKLRSKGTDDTHETSVEFSREGESVEINQISMDACTAIDEFELSASFRGDESYVDNSVVSDAQRRGFESEKKYLSISRQFQHPVSPCEAGGDKKAFELFQKTTPNDSFNESFITASTIEEKHPSPTKLAKTFYSHEGTEGVELSIGISDSSDFEEENHGIDLDDQSTSLILGTAFDDIRSQPKILSASLMEALRCFIPQHLSRENYWLKFSLVRDGTDFDTLRKCVRTSPHTIIAILSNKGDIFGRYVVQIKSSKGVVFSSNCLTNRFYIFIVSPHRHGSYRMSTLAKVILLCGRCAIEKSMRHLHFMMRRVAIRNCMLSLYRQLTRQFNCADMTS